MLRRALSPSERLPAASGPSSTQGLEMAKMSGKMQRWLAGPILHLSGRLTDEQCASDVLRPAMLRRSEGRSMRSSGRQGVKWALHPAENPSFRKSPIKSHSGRYPATASCAGGASPEVRYGDDGH
ncbi:hypothetical protein V497_05626 [Pseudogymnoascus sp. VKM F-4516 (FW-969)]|nr:hypothetical protein V497_05626 [Pseudogymnoascus sp. VKM F-4516 (FW-969)]